jgi:hypothetical protein
VSETATAPAASPPKKRRWRGIFSWIVLVLGAIVLLLAAFSVWVDRVALNSDVFVDTSSRLIEDDEIRKAIATRAVDELFANVDVEAEIEGQLPEDFQNLSGPAAAGLREASYTLVDRALEQPRLQRLWEATLEQSHETLVQVLEGDGDTVSTEGGVVTLDLRPIVLEAAETIGIRNQVEDRLPEDAGLIEVARSDELDAAQDGFRVLNTLAWFLPILTLVLFAVAVWLASDRRRATRRIGFALVLVGVLGLVAVNVVGNYLVNELVADTDSRTAASNAWDILTELLRHSFRIFVVAGILFLVAAWLAGPGTRALGARRFLAPVVQERVWAYLGLAVIGLIVLVAGEVMDFTRFLFVLLVLALGAVWIEVTRAQTAREFPDVSGSAMIDEVQAKLSSWWDSARERAGPDTSSAPPAPTAAADMSTTLATLADLHQRGELTDEEYAAAKARALAGE